MICRFTGDYEFLSNFHEHPLEYAGLVWQTAEHAYQAQKTNNRQEARAIRNALSPAKAKRLGRSVKLVHGWEQMKFEVMTEVIHAKFQVRVLSDLLAETQDQLLIEGNTWGDLVWGAKRLPDGRWTGNNWLGIILMLERQRLFYPTWPLT